MSFASPELLLGLLLVPIALIGVVAAIAPLLASADARMCGSATAAP